MAVPRPPDSPLQPATQHARPSAKVCPLSRQMGWMYSDRVGGVCR